MASTFKLEIITPDRRFFEGDVEGIIVRTTDGDVGILKNHIHMVSPLKIGVVRIKQDGEYKNATCAGGFIQVTNEKTTIITDSAEWPEEVDVKRAEEAKIRAEERIASNRDEIDVDRAKLALARALNRLKVVNR